MKEPTTRRRTLMLWEQLSLPSDVSVVKTKIVSKMTGIEEYVVDLKKKVVMARGDFRPRLVTHHQQVKDVVSQTLSPNAFFDL